MGCWGCLPFASSHSKSKVDTTLSCVAGARGGNESKSKDNGSQDKLAQPIACSTTASNAETTTSNVGSVPPTPIAAEGMQVALQLRIFTYNELKYATKNFQRDNLLGEGGFGRVYKGWIGENGPAPVRPGTGLTVAVKTLNQGGEQGHKEWLAEVIFLGNLRHPNLVKLVGYCIEDNQRQLVYEFMSRGSLENHLFKRSVPLPWYSRVKIALGAAKGLTFLHEEIERPVIFRDFKSSNILIDSDYNAKLSDFGLARDGPEGDNTHVSTRVMGTYGYAAPEYVMTGHLTSKSDVYSFGVVLLELVSGRRSMDRRRPESEYNLVEWARPILRERMRFYKLIDPRLGGYFSVKGAQKLTQLAHACLARDPKARPLMSKAVEALEPLLNLKDMAISSSLFMTMQEERGIRLAGPSGSQSMKVNRSSPGNAQQPARSLSHSPHGRAPPYRPQASPYQGSRQASPYQGSRPQASAYQGSRPQASAYQGSRQASPYQGSRPQASAYQGSRPQASAYQGSRQASAYQGSRPQASAYQGSRPQASSSQGSRSSSQGPRRASPYRQSPRPNAK